MLLHLTAYFFVDHDKMTILIAMGLTTKYNSCSKPAAVGSSKVSSKVSSKDEQEPRVAGSVHLVDGIHKFKRDVRTWCR
jgi:hypothetical protein